mmetsp:Transcript_5071/g.7659  ORF Transcript_5071/g.7659 Transcript_5071/m.7659 type:complete len:126 (+) Transcript_5071:5400-5777(+)
MSAGPKSGETGNRSRHVSYNTASDYTQMVNAGSMLPSVHGHEESKQSTSGRGHRLQNSAAMKGSKSKTRNSILNVSTYQIQGGLPLQQPSLQGPNFQNKAKAMSHVHPELLQKQNIASRSIRPFN